MRKLDWIWISFSASSYLNKLVDKHDTVFEWGAGASTFWFLKRCKSLTSVEHDKNWSDRVCENLNKTNSKLVYAQPSATGFASSSKTGYQNVFFDNYVKAYEEEAMSPDVVFIDGRSRVNCLRVVLRSETLPRLVCFDNPLRWRYRSIWAQARGAGYKCKLRWGLTPGTPFPTSTAFFEL